MSLAPHDSIGEPGARSASAAPGGGFGVHGVNQGKLDCGDHRTVAFTSAPRDLKPPARLPLSAITHSVPEPASYSKCQHRQRRGGRVGAPVQYGDLLYNCVYIFIVHRISDGD